MCLFFVSSKIRPNVNAIPKTEEPPQLINGNVIPVGGISFIEEPIFTNACKHIKKHKLKIVLEINKFEGVKIDLLAIMKNTGYKKATNNPNKTPNSSIKIANIKSL